VLFLWATAPMKPHRIAAHMTKVILVRVEKVIAFLKKPGLSCQISSVWFEDEPGYLGSAEKKEGTRAPSIASSVFLTSLSSGS
jgi:hypothetical protein